MEKKRNVLLYGLNETDKNIIVEYYGDRFSIIDALECFTDILAIPAKIIFLAPAKLSKKDYLQMNEVFPWDDETQIIFTDKPHFPIDVSKVPFSYYVADDIEYISETTP